LLASALPQRLVWPWALGPVGAIFPTDDGFAEVVFNVRHPSANLTARVHVVALAQRGVAAHIAEIERKLSDARRLRDGAVAAVTPHTLVRMQAKAAVSCRKLRSAYAKETIPPRITIDVPTSLVPLKARFTLLQPLATVAEARFLAEDADIVGVVRVALLVRVKRALADLLHATREGTAALLIEITLCTMWSPGKGLSAAAALARWRGGTVIAILEV